MNLSAGIFASQPFIITAFIALVAILLDWLLGEPRRYHPLIGFGRLANVIERWLNHTPHSATRPADKTNGPSLDAQNIEPNERRSTWRLLSGAFALSLALIPITALATGLAMLPIIGPGISALLLYLALGHRSLKDHALPIAQAMQQGDNADARILAGRIVSRDAATLDIAGATTESVLENGNDAVFGALFWFALAGAPGVVVYRLTNTLDAMWGYKTARFKHFGWAAARLDDALNYIPARLTALTYALVAYALHATHLIKGSTGIKRSKGAIHSTLWQAQIWQAVKRWHIQAAAWDSPNAGPVMAAGANALGITIGGPARYRGQWHQRPVLGFGRPPTASDIGRALDLVHGGVWLWIALLGALGLVGGC